MPLVNFQEAEVLQPLLRLLLRHKWTICAFVCTALLGAFVQHTLFPSFKSTSSIQVRPQDLKATNPSTAKNSLASLSGQEPEYTKYIKVLKSEGFRRYISEQISETPKIESRLKSLFEEMQNRSSDAQAEILLKHTEYRGRDDDIIETITETSGQESAIFIANLMSQLAKKYIVIDENRETTETSDYVTTELAKELARIESLNKEIEAIKTKEDMLNVTYGDSLPLAIKSIQAFHDELEKLRVKISENSYFDAELTKQLKAGSSGNDLKHEADLLNLRGRLVDQLKGLRETEKADHARMRALETRLASLKGSLQPQFEQRILDIKSRLSLENQIILDLKKQLYQIGLQKTTTEKIVREYMRASISNTERKMPLGKKLLMAMIFAFVFASLIICLRDRLAPTVKSVRQFQDLGIRVASSIPPLGSGFSSKLIDFTTNTREAIAFKTLRIQLLDWLRSSPNRPLVIAITSPNTGEGKSTIAANLVHCFTSYQVKTVFLSTSDLGEKENGESFLKNISTRISELEDSCEVIIFETPSFFASNQAMDIRHVAHAVIVIAELYQTKVTDLATVIEILRLNNVKRIFGIANMAPDATRPGLMAQAQVISIEGNNSTKRLKESS